MSPVSFYLGYAVPASTLIPITAGIIYYKKLSTAMHRIILYLCIALFFNIVGSVLASYRINNLPGLHLYTLAELVAITWYYRAAFPNGWANKWTTIVMVAFPILCVINFSYFQSIYTFNTYTRPLEAVLVIVFSSIYLSRQGNFDQKENLNKAGRLVASGFLLYFCSSFFQFIFSNVISRISNRTITDVIWCLHATFVLIMYIMFFVAIKHERGKR